MKKAPSYVNIVKTITCVGWKEEIIVQGMSGINALTTYKKSADLIQIYRRKNYNCKSIAMSGSFPSASSRQVCENEPLLIRGESASSDITQHAVAEQLRP